MKAQLLADFRGLSEDSSPDDGEEQTMWIVLKRHETSTGADRIADVLSRKPSYANNTGAVKGESLRYQRAARERVHQDA